MYSANVTSLRYKWQIVWEWRDVLYYNTQEALAKAEDETTCQNEIKCIEYTVNSWEFKPIQVWVYFKQTWSFHCPDVVSWHYNTTKLEKAFIVWGSMQHIFNFASKHLQLPFRALLRAWTKFCSPKHSRKMYDITQMIISAFLLYIRCHHDLGNQVLFYL